MSPSSLFVYGTLMPGRLRWPILEPFATGHRRALVVGSLFDSGRGWPVATFDGAPRGEVPGVLVELDRGTLARCLAVIDEVEGVAAGQYRRIVVTTTAGDETWAYDFSALADGLADRLTPIARWDVVPLTDER